MRFIIVLFFATFLWQSCVQPRKEKKEAFNPAEVLNFRQEKDRVFRDAAKSPLLPEDLKNFSGLKYFPVDSTLRFTGPIIKYQPMPRVSIVATGGDVRPALKYGYFQFLYQGKEYKLQIYKMLNPDPGTEKELFLGFTDATSGKTTYGGGRYVDLEENFKNFYTVDFNLAYNPYCAYNPRFSCTVPPRENYLPFPVKAGEKTFKSH